MYTPITVTPYAPSGSAITLPMPESVDDRDYDVSFIFKDPTDGAGTPVNIEALLSGHLCDGSIQTPIITRSNKVKRLARDPNPMVRVQWKRIEPFSGVEVDYSAYGGLYIAAKPFSRNDYSLTVVLYKAHFIIGVPSKTVRSAP